MNIRNQRGNVLLFVISGIAMAAAIGIGMFYMTSTSSLGQMSGNAMDRAHYLALAGKNYALANWKSRTSWNNAEFSLSDKERFMLSYSGDEITSIGIVNKATAIEARKEIKAKSPSPTFAKTEWSDTFKNLTNWDASTKIGGFATQLVSGDQALVVTATGNSFGSSGNWSWLQFNTGAAGVDLTTPWKNAGYCLSYDLQVKIANNQPYYAAGLIFKAEGIGDSRVFYGVSYMRTKQQYRCDGGCKWERDDNIPDGIKPTTTGSDGIFTEPLQYLDPTHRYSRPAIVLWKKDGSGFTWLAYKLLSSPNFVVDDSSLLKQWSNLQVRLIEAYPQSFTNGGPTPLLYGTTVVGAASGAQARINGTPILTAETWSSSSASGTLTLDGIIGTFQSGENLLVNGQICAKASGTLGSKANYIRVYYGDVSDHTPANDTPTDDNRKGNPRLTTGSSNRVHWPIDDVSYWNADNDYLTLVQWAEANSSATKLGGVGTKEADAIIRDSSLLTPDSGTIAYSGIALHATGDTATSTYFDDFAIQY